MDQTENDLHTTVMSVELVRRLTNKLFENDYAGHFVNKHTCIQGLSREGISEEGIQTSCVTSSSLVPYVGVLCRHTMHVKLLGDHFLFTLFPFPSNIVTFFAD